MKQIKAILTITIDYDAETITDKNIVYAILHDAANHLSANGLLSGEADIEINSWNSEVKIEEN